MVDATLRTDLPPTPFAAATSGFGEGSTATIHRYQLDARRCGLRQTGGPAWVWGYTVECDGWRWQYLGTGLVEARLFAARVAERVVESWPRGKTWARGAKGGLRKA